MPDETGDENAIDGESQAIPLTAESVEEVDEATGRAQEPRPESASQTARVETAGAVASPKMVQKPTEAAATPAAPSSVAAALEAAAEQIRGERDASAGDAAALAEALRTFLNAFASQNAPTRSEFRDLAAQLDRLSSQFQKGR